MQNDLCQIFPIFSNITAFNLLYCDFLFIFLFFLLQLYSVEAKSLLIMVFGP